MNVQARQTWRGLVRELARHHAHARVKAMEARARNAAARDQLASRSGKPPQPSNEPEESEFPRRYDTSSLKDMLRVMPLEYADAYEVVEYLKHQRIYKELLERYQVGPADTQERVRMTAKRVGLDADDL